LRAWVAFALAGVAGCSSPDTNSDWAKSVTFERVAKDEITKRLKDPESAAFRNFQYDIKRGVICGEYNARNAFGGMTGFSSFVIANDMVYLEEAGGDEISLQRVKCLSAQPQDLLDGHP
jgi:hypothetical protein